MTMVMIVACFDEVCACVAVIVTCFGDNCVMVSQVLDNDRRTRTVEHNDGAWVCHCLCDPAYAVLVIYVG